MANIDPLAMLKEMRRAAHPDDSAAATLDNAIRRLERAADTGYVGALYRTDYQVVGRGAFPIDMLRYTSSWPTNEEAAHAIENSLEGYGGEFTVTLTKHHRDRLPILSEERWQSKFGWAVKRILLTVEV